MLFTELNEDNFQIFAIKNYENPQAVTKEDFEKDLNHFQSVFARLMCLRTEIFLEHYHF